MASKEIKAKIISRSEVGHLVSFLKKKKKCIHEFEKGKDMLDARSCRVKGKITQTLYKENLLTRPDSDRCTAQCCPCILVEKDSPSENLWSNHWKGSHIRNASC